ncbi:MAG: hypothetical protein ACYDAI_08815 [Trichloromonadaceae bacterium]
MSKYLKTAAAALALVALAAPAMADQKISGYFRTQFVADNFNGPPFTTTFGQMASDDKRTATQIDNRFRLMYQNNLNEYVSFVYFAEIDTAWGQSGKAAAGQGGTDGADGVNVETKNVYLDFKIPDSIVSARIGVQGVGLGPDGIVLGDDMAAARVNLQFSPMVNVTTVYSKWRENDITEWDDVDFYAATLNLKPSDAIKFNLDLGYLDQNSFKAQVGPFDTTAFALIRDGLEDLGLTAADAIALAGETSSELIVVGVGAEANLGAAKLTGYAAHTNGKMEFGPGVPDTDLSGFMATAKVTAKLGMADTGLRLTWYSADDDATDDEYNGFIGDLSGGVYEFAGENLSIFFADALYNNTNGGRRALIDAAYQGHGLLAINATANMNFTKTVYGKFGAGYFMATEDAANEIGSAKEDKELGIEVAARVGTKIAEKVDLSLGGAYAFLGDFYQVGTTDPDNVYKVSVALNVPF